MNDLTFTRKGPGDLPGNSRHPNSPDYVEPVFGLDDAAGVVARKLWNGDEVGEIVDDLAEAASALRRIKNGQPLDSFYIAALNRVLIHAERMERMRETEFEILNDNCQTGPEDWE